MELTSNKTALKALISEDSRTNAAVLTATMKKSAVFTYNFSYSKSSADTVRQLSEQQFDVVMQDLNLTDTKGLETLDRLGDLCHKQAVIIVSSHEDLKIANRALQMGARDYILKGAADASNIDRIVLYALERHKMCNARDKNILELEETKHRHNRMLTALDLAHAELEAQQAKSKMLTQAIEQARETVVITDLDGTIQYVNDAFVKITGYSKDDALGQTPRILKSGQHDNEFYKKLWHNLITTGQWNGKIRNRRQDGTIYEEDCRISVVYDNTHRPINYVAVKKDITHENALEMQLAQARKLEAIGQLAAGIAHEINTPTQFVGDNTRYLSDAFKDLKSIIDHYQKIQQTCEANSDYTAEYNVLKTKCEEIDLPFLMKDIPEAISQTLQGIDRISKIVRAMKEFSHPGGTELNAEDLNKALQSTITICANEWKYHCEIETDFDKTLPMVPCLLGEMNQVFLNIIVNASHAIAEKKAREKGTITIRTRQVDDYAHIEISDTGCGIPNRIIDKIFDPFFTTKEVGKGTGQGLTMAHTTVVDKHHGHLNVESTPGEGSRFIIELPFAQPAAKNGTGGAL